MQNIKINPAEPLHHNPSSLATIYTDKNQISGIRQQIYCDKDQISRNTKENVSGYFIFLSTLSIAGFSAKITLSMVTWNCGKFSLIHLHFEKDLLI